MKTIQDIIEYAQKTGGAVIVSDCKFRHNPAQKLTGVTTATFAACVAAIDSGKKILIGNSPHGPGEMIARTNSNSHGHCIRTIRAI